MTPEQVVKCSAPYCREKATIVMYEDPATRLSVPPSDPKGKPRGYCTEHNGERLSEAMRIRKGANR